ILCDATALGTHVPNLLRSLDDPRVLLCSHSFCKKCLEGLLEGNRGPAFRTPFRCPTCRKETPHNGASSLQINYSLRGIVEKYSKIRRAPKMSECKQHCGQPLNIFCATDLNLICGFCATTDDHKGHAFCSVEEAHGREKEAFEVLLLGLKSWQSTDVLSCLETRQASKKRALLSLTQDAEKVTDYFDRLISTIECKKNEILSDFETLKLGVLQDYDPVITGLSATMEDHRRALSFAESLPSVADPLRFLQKMREFREKLKVLPTTPPPLPSRGDSDVGALVRNFDVKKWDSLRLREVDRISVPHENGSYRTGGSQMAAPSWIRLNLCMIVLLSTTTTLMLQPHDLASYVPSQIEPLLAAASSYLTHTGAHLREIAGMCASFLGDGQECIWDLIDSAVNFIDHL
uniref:Tripartite motif containing 13 n=1 Tax=Cyclopterus lumpus TaxID=8103 RepID=A0A8C3G2P2_CYCLU